MPQPFVIVGNVLAEVCPISLLKAQQLRHQPRVVRVLAALARGGKHVGPQRVRRSATALYGGHLVMSITQLATFLEFRKFQDFWYSFLVG